MAALCITSFLMFLIGAFGIFGNLNLITVTLRTLPALKRSRCGLLIGILAFADLICIVFEWQNAIRLFVGTQNFRRSCFWAISPYLYVINFQATLILVIAADRVFAIFFPFKYRTLDFCIYVTVCMLPGVVCASTIFGLALVYMDDDRIEACNPPLGYPPLVSRIWNRWILVVDCLTILLYVLAFVVLYVKTRQVTKSSPEYAFLRQQKKLMHTLSIVIVAFVCSWFFCHFSVLFVTLIGLDENTVHVFQTIAVIPAMMCYSQNYYIYLWRSKEYRGLFKEQLRLLFNCCSTRYCSSNTVTVKVISNLSVGSSERG